ncbi:hypothetical protein HL658_35205 [Azospirillum sp. RWY-5-1]|uniref:Cupin n=1 Tax=Azospirillum oleiclasticum TaxID=2735135 RepID=A0ABX2TL72_9PROT|nr:hypothetical protein [Azospirillum oleiclasticum]NYZ17820.1 hypothetical protein [Azospirillum oleiclasticum]NYZ25048.1 hypothetical protein [Azospirillum oleiclasticum]
MDVHRIDDFKGGWFIGDFEPALLRTAGFEVGWKVHHRTEFIAPHIHQQLTEYNLLAHGSMRVNGRELGPGDLFILHKGERVDAEVLTEEAHVVCVKVPSVPSDKVMCDPAS